MILFTMGYTGSSHEQIATIARSHNAIVLDIRFHATSKEARWNRPQLASAMSIEGVEYAWLPALGNVNHGTSKPIQLSVPDQGIAFVCEKLEHRSVVLLCACQYAEDCHRSLVADMVVKAMPGVEVRHLGPRKPTKATTAQMGLW